MLQWFFLIQGKIVCMMSVSYPRSSKNSLLFFLQENILFLNVKFPCLILVFWGVYSFPISLPCFHRFVFNNIKVFYINSTEFISVKG